MKIRPFSIEPLEARIAPAAFQLPAGGGPYVLELDPTTSHVHIKDGTGTEVFDDGLNPNDITITAAGTDDLTIQDSTAGSLHFTGPVNISIAGSIQVTGGLSTQGTGTIDLTTTRDINLNAGSSIGDSNGAIHLTALGTAAGNYAGLVIDGTVLTTGNGSIFLTGTGGNTGTANHGIFQHGTVQAVGGTGAITYNGHGGVGGTDNNIGIAIATGAQINAGASGVVLQGSPGTDAGQSVGIDLSIGIVSAGDVHLATDSGLQFESGSAVTATGKTVFIEPLTASPTVHVGTAPRTGVGVTSAIIAAITADTVLVGTSTGGSITVDGALTSTVNLSLVTAGGITGASALTLSAGKLLSTTSNNAVNLTGAITAPGGTAIHSDVAHLIDVSLANTGNDLGTVSVDHGGNVSLRDDTAFDLGNISFGTRLTVQSAGTITESGSLTGGGQLFKTGNGRLTLSTPSTIGDTTIESGTIAFSDPGAFGTGTVFLGDGTTGISPVSLLATVAFNQGVFTTPIVVPNLGSASVATIGTDTGTPGTPATFSSSLTLNRPTVLQAGFVGETHFVGVISGNVQTLTIAGNGNTLGLGGSVGNTFTGDVMVTGTVALQLDPGPDAIPDNSNVDIAAGAEMKFAKAAGANETINSLTGTGVVKGVPSTATSPQTLTIGAGDGTFTFNGTLQDGLSPLSIVKAGTGTATLAGTETYSGNTTISNGTLALVSASSDNPLANSGRIILQNGSHLDLSGLTAAADPQTLVLSVGQNLVGPGTIDGSLSGSGSIAANDMSLAGILTINGNFTPSGQVEVTANAPYATAGSDYSQYVVSGNVDLSAATFFFDGGFGFAGTGASMTIISKTSAGAITPPATPAEGTKVFFNQGGFQVSYHGNDGNDFVLTTAIGMNSLTPTLKNGVLTINETLNQDTHLFITYSLGELILQDSAEFFTAAAGGTLGASNHALTFNAARAIKSIVYNGGSGDDNITLNLFDGKIAAGGVIVHGNGQATAAGNQLRLSSFEDEGTVTYGFTSANDGSVAMSKFGKATYTGITKLFNFGTATDVIFNLPVLAATSQNIVTFGEDDAINDGRSQLLSAGTFEPVVFANPSHALTFHRGTANDRLTIDGPTDFNSSLTIGDAAHPFFRVDESNDFILTGTGKTLNIATNTLLLSSLQTISAPAGMLTVSQGNLDGTIAGGLGLTAVGQTFLNLTGFNTYTGDTFVRGPLTLGNTVAAQFSTIHVESSFALQFTQGIGTFIIGGLAGAGSVPLQDDNTSPIDLQVGNNNGVASYSGKLLGGGTLTKIGTGTQTLTGANDHDATILESGILQVSSDKALGHTGDQVISDGGTLRAIATFTSTRPIFLQSGDTDFAATSGQTMTLAGVLSGTGSYHIDGPGQVFITGTQNTNTGSFEMNSKGTVMVNGVQISAPGAKGDVVITPGTTANTVQSIDLTPAKKALSLVVKVPKNGAPVTVDNIVNGDTTTIKKITLGTGVTLGDGMDDDMPDLAIDGMLGKLQLDQVSTHTIMTLGKDLPYLSTYKNHPSLALATLGDDVTIDVTGDGVTPAGVGGGGLGKVAIGSWGTGGLIKTTQSIASFVVKTGDFNGVIQVDPHHLGAFTTASVGKLSIPQGQWTGSGMQVEGVVAQFLTLGLAQGSEISAGAFGKVNIKGNYAGSVVATADLAVTKTVKGKTTVVATGAIASVSVTGDFTGMINGDGAVGAVTVTGTGRFEGILRGGSIKSITATSFVGPNDGAHNTITAIGSIGNITATTGSLNNYIIAAGTDLGADAMFGGIDTDADHFASFLSDAKGKKTAVSIGNITVKGEVNGTSIAAGIDPGALGIYGDGDDITANPAGGTIKTKIGALKFQSSGAITQTFASTPGDTVKDAFEAETMTSVQFGAAKNTPTFISSFTDSHYIDALSASTIVRLLS